MTRITAIMPTADRRRYVPAAIAQFLAQQRADAELLILDDGADPVADLVPGDPRIRYVREEARRPIGDKRNRACALARGEIIVHWDDDDWHAPDRMARQVAALDETGADICGLAHVPFLAEDGSAAWDYRWGGRHRWVYGASLAYRRTWQQLHPFQPLARGEDTRFLFDARGAQVLVMPESGWLVARVHAGNTCPKQVTGGYWHPRDPAPLQALVARWSDSPPAEPVRLLRNVHAVLAHEKPECVVDLVRNLRWHDDVSPILLYDGSADGGLIDRRLPWGRWGVEIVPDPRPMKWGTLHGFALDCLRHLEGRGFDMMTIVDSDQMMLRRGYAEFLSRQLAGQPFGVLSSDPRPQRADTRIPPAQTAQAERALWQPFLDRFENGADCFARWTFWPATVIGAEAGQAIRRLFEDEMLRGILKRSRLWATEEILFPTLAALLGFPVVQNPCAGQWTQYRRAWSGRDLDQATRTGSAYWMHPVPRQLDHGLRRALRERCGQYRLAAPAPLPQATDEPLLAAMRATPGWLEEDEARAVLAAARSAGDGAHLVEIGSYCGKATLLLGAAAREGGGRVTAIDRFDGLLGSREDRLLREAPSRIRFDRTIAELDLAGTVSARTGDAPTMMPAEPIDLLLVDGLHDYPAVAADFAAAEPWLRPEARVLFHDYADYFPGVMALVDELVASGDWQMEAAAGTLRVLRRAAAASAESRGTVALPARRCAG